MANNVYGSYIAFVGQLNWSLWFMGSCYLKDSALGFMDCRVCLTHMLKPQFINDANTSLLTSLLIVNPLILDFIHVVYLYTFFYFYTVNIYDARQKQCDL